MYLLLYINMEEHEHVDADVRTYMQSWARAFFYASRFSSLVRSSSRSFLGLKFSAFEFALPAHFFCAPPFFTLFFAVLDFSRSFSRSSIFRALFRAPQFFALIHLRSLFSRS
jgi:hypothetical protein